MSKDTTPVVATKRINGTIEPGTIFVPAEHGLAEAELRALDAVQDCSDADLAVHAQQHGVGKSAPHAAGNSAAAKKAKAKAAAEAKAKAAAEAEAEAAAEAEAEAKAAAAAEQDDDGDDGGAAASEAAGGNDDADASDNIG